MGCPAKKVVKRYAGSALMKDLSLAEEIIKSVVKATSLPTTLKMRLGWDENTRNSPDLAKIAISFLKYKGLLFSSLAGPILFFLQILIA